MHAKDHARRCILLLSFPFLVGILTGLSGCRNPSEVECERNMRKLYLAIQQYAGNNNGLLPRSYEDIATEMPVGAVWTHAWCSKRKISSAKSLASESGFRYWGKGEKMRAYPTDRPLLVVKQANDSRPKLAMFIGGKIVEYSKWSEIEGLRGGKRTRTRTDSQPK